ncbi:MAG: hypothetical protein GX206_03370 [Clostridiales bacterium]|nr:hypothetical protein [Clostridiales bacterium]
MSVIILNRKRLGVTIIILGLMLVLVGIETSLSHRLKTTVLIQNGFANLKQYTIENSGLTYKLPDSWETSKQDLGGGDILYHNNFMYTNGNIHGFVQLWNSKGKELKSFIESSKSSAYKPDQISNYQYKPITIKDYKAYLLTYNAKTSSGKDIKASEYFIDNGKSFFRMAFFVPSDKYKENMPAIFDAIVSTYEKGQ